MSYFFLQILSDDEGEHDIDLNKFDNHRIQLPTLEVNTGAVVESKPRNGLNIPTIDTGVQFTHDGKSFQHNKLFFSIIVD